MSKRDAQRFVTKFLDLVPVRKLSGNHFVSGDLVATARSELSDIPYISAALRRAVAALPGGYDAGDDFKVEVIDTEAGFFVFAKLDFDRINRARAGLRPALEPLTMAHLLTKHFEACVDTALAAFYGCDFVTSTTTSEIIQIKHSELLRRSELNHQARDTFHEFVLRDAPSVAEVIDSGEKTFDEFLRLLDRSERFKQWLAQTNPDENLVKAYLKAVTSETWLESIPAKTARYMLAAGLGTFNPVIGAIAGLVDTFLLDKLLKGWRPNHFVKDRLEPFVAEHR